MQVNKTPVRDLSKSLLAACKAELNGVSMDVHEAKSEVDKDALSKSLLAQKAVLQRTLTAVSQIAQTGPDIISLHSPENPSPKLLLWAAFIHAAEERTAREILAAMEDLKEKKKITMNLRAWIQLMGTLLQKV